MLNLNEIIVVYTFRTEIDQLGNRREMHTNGI